MSTAELKIDLINKITKLKEGRIIEEINKLLDFELDNSEYKLSVTQRNRIFEAKNDKVLTEEEANNEIDEWLKGKQIRQKRPILNEKKFLIIGLDTTNRKIIV